MKKGDLKFGVAIVLILTMVLVLLTGCGNENSETQNAENTQISQVDEERQETQNETEAISDMEISSFNSKFEQYEGNQRGTVVKSLIATVSSSNLADTDKIVTVVMNGKEASTSSDLSSMSSEVMTGMTYNVTLEYENELVTRIVIAQ